MSTDTVARGLAVLARQLAPRVPIAICIKGQSNERGQVDPAELIGGVSSLAAYPQAYRSLRNPGLSYPVGPAVTKQGGLWFKLYDDLWDWGYDAQMINLGIGSASFLDDFAGRVKSWIASSGYRTRRAAVTGSCDRGFTGDLIVESARIFQCETGNSALAMHNGPGPVPGGLAVNLDYLNTIGAAATGATKPAGFATANLGDLIPDGTVVWRCVSITPTWNGLSYASGQIMSEGRIGFGFDPYGLLGRAHELVQQVRNARVKIMIYQQAQSDVSATSADYGTALQNMCGYDLQRGYYVMPGLSVYQPSVGTGPYNTLTTGVNSATAAQQAGALGAFVKPGANLYTLLGSAGNMAAGGAYFAKDVGQDNIHLNARGAIAAGAAVATTIKAWLPQVVR
ncbi:hypothetical protein [Sphingomonas sp.]|uniref:hypothetical protein n=1 Tax=Sphingomonas sp. TaxID=28214 RepID=UPI0025D0414C|nr:hypothetical protein [Sphingomonas sp.]